MPDQKNEYEVSELEETIEDNDTVDNVEIAEESVESEEKESNVDKKILRLTLLYVICSCLYFLFVALSRFPQLEGEITHSGMNQILHVIMWISAFVSLIGVIGIVLFKTKRLEKVTTVVKKTIYEVFDWLVILPACITIATFCFNFVFTFVVVDGSSMNPNYSNLEQLMIFNYSTHERFDVVAIHVNPKNYFSTNEDTLFLKRIIGLPGEAIHFATENGRTYLYVQEPNSGMIKKVTEVFFNEVDNPTNYNTYIRAGSFEEFDWNSVCKIKDDRCLDTEYGLVIPEGYYFVLGDNRQVSNDSRTIGLVKESDIFGTVKYKVLSFFHYEKVK